MKMLLLFMLLSISNSSFAVTDAEFNSLKAEIAKLRSLGVIQQQNIDRLTNEMSEKFGGAGFRLCTGNSSDQSWKPNSSSSSGSGIWIEIDTSKCNFTETPRYFTNLRGDTMHWRMVGTTSIYHPSKSKFTINLWSSGTEALKMSEDQNFYIEWVALGK